MDSAQHVQVLNTIHLDIVMIAQQIVSRVWIVMQIVHPVFQENTLMEIIAYPVLLHVLSATIRINVLCVSLDIGLVVKLVQNVMINVSLVLLKLNANLALMVIT